MKGVKYPAPHQIPPRCHSLIIFRLNRTRVTQNRQVSSLPKPQWESARLCRGGSRILTFPVVDTEGPSTKLRIVSRQAHEEEFVTISCSKWERKHHSAHLNRGRVSVPKQPLLSGLYYILKSSCSVGGILAFFTPLP